MDLSPGSRLGPYELVAPLGAGGMGEVYRAHDTRLGRDVALKVLADARLTDSAARARFEREMAVVARLAHPRICTLLDVGHDGDRLYFAMELLRGETLATRLDRAGAQGLALDEALDVAVGVCSALAYAHRHGVVHRDVKPANVMLTPDGVKLLDFGVARLFEPDTAVDAKASTSTVSILGTPAYMAPEQIDGLADPRADLFSVGAVLYEMLAGQRAFPGETSSEVLGAVVRCAPMPLSDLRPALPPVVSRLVHRCLQKSVEDRWQSASDLGEALRWARDPQALPAAEVPVRRPELRRKVGAWVAVGAAAVIGALAAGLVSRSPDPAQAAPETYVDDVPLPDESVWVPGQMAVSRDGRRVAIITQRPVRDVVDFRLWIHDIGAGRGWQLVDGAGPEHVTYPSWSPDGASLAYFRDHKLVRLPLTTGVPVALAEAPDGRGTAWLDDDTILYAPDAQSDLWRVPAHGGDARAAIRREAGDLGVKFPTSVDAGHVLYWAQRSTPESGEIRVRSLAEAGPSRVLTQSSTAGTVIGTSLFFVNNHQVVAQHLDRQSWRLDGATTQVPAELGMGGNLGAPHFAGGGSVLGVQSQRREASALTWVDRTGAMLGTVGPVAPYRTMALSPDGQQLITESAAPGIDMAQLWLMDARSATPRHLVTDVGAMLPTWHPGLARVAFRASRGPGGSGAVYDFSLNGRAVQTLVETPTLASARPAAWIDADRLLWWAADASGRYNGIFVAEPGRFDRPVRTLRIGVDIRGVALRPGGQGLAYWSNESGTFEVYVDTFPEPRPSPLKVSLGGGRLPRWSPDGQELFFVSDGALHVAPMTGPNGAPAGPPHRLFAFEGADYDVHPDGRLLVQRRRLPESHYLRLLRNWPAQTASTLAARR